MKKAFYTLALLLCFAFVATSQSDFADVIGKNIDPGFYQPSITLTPGNSVTLEYTPDSGTVTITPAVFYPEQKVTITPAIYFGAPTQTLSLLNVEQTSLTNATSIKTKLLAIGLYRDVVPGNIFYHTVLGEALAVNNNEFGMLRSIGLVTGEIIDGASTSFVRSWTQTELEMFIGLRFNGVVSITYTPVLLTWKCTITTTGGTYNNTTLTKVNALALSLLDALNDPGSGVTVR